MSDTYVTGYAIGTWLARHRVCYGDYQSAIAALRVVENYLWLAAGLLLIWIGLIGMLFIHATGMPSFPAGGVIIGPMCLYHFLKLRITSSKTHYKIPS